MTDLLDKARKLEEQLRADYSARLKLNYCPDCACSSCADCHCSLSHAERDRLSEAADTMRDLCAEVERLTMDLEREEADCSQLIAERDQREQQINEIADALGDETEWSNLNDRGDNAYELAAALVQRADAALARAKELEGQLSGARADLDHVSANWRLCEEVNDKLEDRVKELEAEVLGYRSDIDKLQRELEAAQDERCHHPREWNEP